MIQILIGLLFCAVIIGCTVAPSVVYYRRSREIRYLSGIMTEEGPNEWLDESLEEFQSWEEVPESIPFLVERKKP